MPQSIILLRYVAVIIFWSSHFEFQLIRCISQLYLVATRHFRDGK